MKKEKLLSVIVAAALSCSLFSTVPIVSQAVEDSKEYTSGDYTYILENGGCTITKYSGSDKNLVIPSTLDGHTVLAIADRYYDNNSGKNVGVFAGREDITSLTIPDTMQSIGEYAFYQCTGLTNVDIGNSVRSLEHLCFGDCDSLTSIEIPASMTSADSYSSMPFSGCDSLKTVTIASGGVKIPAGLFYCCTALENVSIPEGITTIGESGNSQGGFHTCSSLKKIVLPDSIKVLDYDSFWCCSSLTEITLPENTELVGPLAFAGCRFLKDIYDYSKKTKYDYSVFGFSEIPPVTMHGYPGSDMEKFAKGHDLPFVPLTGEEPKETEEVVDGVDVYRLYNPLSGEHFYTASKEERDFLKSGIWYYEGIGWTAPEYSNHPVYRLCNPNTGDHHYTIDENERDICVGYGWICEGIGWYSDDAQTVPVYRDFNPNAVMGTHNYTTSNSEHDNIVSLGWRSEDIGWYVAAQGRGDAEADYYPYMKTDDVRWGHLSDYELNDRRVIITKGYSYSRTKQDELSIPFYGIIDGRLADFMVLQKDGSVYFATTPTYGTPWTLAYNTYGDFSGYYGEKGTRVYPGGVSEEKIKEALDQGIDPATIYPDIIEW